MSGIYPNTFYRVSLKAIIHDSQNRVLVVKEKGSAWSLPGGGMDHGESVHDALKRELYEEVLITSSFTAKIIAAEPMFVETKDAWLLWLVFKVDVKNMEYGVGEHADEVAFMDPQLFKNSLFRSERLVYKFTAQPTDRNL